MKPKHLTLEFTPIFYPKAPRKEQKRIQPKSQGKYSGCRKDSSIFRVDLIDRISLTLFWLIAYFSQIIGGYNWMSTVKRRRWHEAQHSFMSVLLRGSVFQGSPQRPCPVGSSTCAKNPPAGYIFSLLVKWV